MHSITNEMDPQPTIKMFINITDIKLLIHVSVNNFITRQVSDESSVFDDSKSAFLIFSSKVSAGSNPGKSAGI